MIKQQLFPYAAIRAWLLTSEMGGVYWLSSVCMFVIHYVQFNLNYERLLMS